jgi:hypothetical protein
MSAFYANIPEHSPVSEEDETSQFGASLFSAVNLGHVGKEFHNAATVAVLIVVPATQHHISHLLAM